MRVSASAENEKKGEWYTEREKVEKLGEKKSLSLKKDRKDFVIFILHRLKYVRH